MSTTKLKRRINYANVKRGDTIIEVMFAIAVFCLVAVISISMMNLGVANAENALETVVARNEINAQAEALRFIHSSYISEKTLPESYNPNQPTERYQQYRELWETIIDNAVTPTDAKDSGLLDLAETVNNKDSDGGTIKLGCARVYDNSHGENLLTKVKAFVLNTRDISSLRTVTIGSDSSQQADVGVSYISTQNLSQRAKFVEATLNARIIYSSVDQTIPGDSSQQFTDGGYNIYNRVLLAEGIWVFAVTDGATNPHESKYFDFYIEACWYGPNTVSPTAVDTVIRLYNPEGI